MEQNENFTLIKSRITYDIQTCESDIDKELNKKLNLEKELSDIQNIIEQTECDVEKVLNVGISFFFKLALPYY